MDEQEISVSDIVDRMCLKGEFEKVDSIFKILCDEIFEEAFQQITQSLELLMVTNGAQDELQHRQRFVQKLEKAIDEDDELESSELMLCGLY